MSREGRRTPAGGQALKHGTWRRSSLEFVATAQPSRERCVKEWSVFPRSNLIAAKSSVKASVGSVTCNRVWGKPGVCMKGQPSEEQWRKEPPSTLGSLKRAPTRANAARYYTRDVTRDTRSGRRQVGPTYVHKGCEVCAFKGCESRRRSSRTSRKSSKAGQLVIDTPSGR